MGIWPGAGATRSWLHSPSWSKSFVGIKKSVNSAEIVYLDEKRNGQRWQWNTNWQQKKRFPDAWKGRLPWNSDPFLYNRRLLVDFLWFLIKYLWNISISLFLCATVDFGCSWFVDQNWTISLQNGNLLLMFEELNSKVNLSLPTVLIQRSVFII